MVSLVWFCGRKRGIGEGGFRIALGGEKLEDKGEGLHDNQVVGISSIPLGRYLFRMSKVGTLEQVRAPAICGGETRLMPRHGYNKISALCILSLRRKKLSNGIIERTETTKSNTQ